jgi:haloacetate dehalogenase
MAGVIERGPSPFLAGFRLIDVMLAPDHWIRAAAGGSGPPLLLLHGHPQTHATWRKIAPVLAEHFSVIAADLRGYGDSAKPAGGPDHIGYSKREMAKDQVAVMAALGHERFGLIGHDRGARVAHRLALDHPEAVDRIALFDIAPTATMYERTDKVFASRYFWWFFLIQPAPLPERLISGDPEFFLRTHIDGQNKTEGATEPEAFAEYLRCYLDPATRHAICEDYRAAAGIDLDHDAEDAEKRIEAPLLALWGAKGTVGHLYDVLQTWREKARHVEGRALPCGHTLQEEVPDETSKELLAFFLR